MPIKTSKPTTTVKRVGRSFHILAGGFRKCEVKQYQGRDHLVVPVIALVEGVVWASNAEAPELVLASELAKAPGGWNGRPVMMNHPTSDGQAISANIPAVLEEFSFGHVFDTELKEDKLAMNAWLDLEKAKSVEGAEDLIAAIENDDMVEISVGVYVTMEESVGEFDGKPYRAVWREIVPDHLALLPEGTIGACSNEMGCGVPRSATLHVSTSRGLVALSAKERGTMKGFKAAKAAWDTYLATVLVAASLSDRDIRDRLNKALAEEDPYCLGVEAVYQEEGKVVYAAWGDKGLVFYRRGYTKAEDDKVTLNDDREDVIRQDLFVTASAKPGGCGCGHSTNKEPVAMEKKARVKALIARKDNAYVEADATYLESLSDERLKALEDFKPEAEKAEKTEVVDDTKKTTTVVDPDPPKKDKGADEEGKPGPKPAAKTAEEYVADAPPEVQAALQEGMKAAAAKKGALIKALRDSKRCDYTDAELKAMSIADLERMAKLAAAEVPEIDYSAQGGPRELKKAEDAKVPAAPSLFDNVRQMAGRSKETKSA